MTMDPLTHTLLGSIGAHAVFGRTLGRPALLIGGVSGLAADVDVTFAPLSDPALPMELHRHFTHSLAFIPIGAAITAAPFLLLSRWRGQWQAVIGASLIGWALHGFLDVCTSYGTHWFWPFSNARPAWDIISIIDPIFTGVLILATLLIVLLRTPMFAAAALALCGTYLSFGLVQKHRTLDAQRMIAEVRGHDIERGRVMPTLGNLIVWRSLYETEGVLHADALRVGIAGDVRVRHGDSIARVSRSDLDTDLIADDANRRRLDVFFHFADDFVARPEGRPQVLADMRYSIVPESFLPMWGIEYDLKTTNPHTEWTIRWVGMNRGRRRDAVADLWHDLCDAGRFNAIDEAADVPE